MRKRNEIKKSFKEWPYLSWLGPEVAFKFGLIREHQRHLVYMDSKHDEPQIKNIKMNNNQKD